MRLSGWVWIPASGKSGVARGDRVAENGLCAISSSADSRRYVKVVLMFGLSLDRWPLAQTLRYHIDRNALRLVVHGHKELSSHPETLHRRLVLFAHYDPQDQIDPYVVYYLRQLHELGSEILFVSGSTDLTKAACAPIEPICAGIYTKRNLSLDFGSWNVAWQVLRRKGWALDDFDQLILANDSVYGPLFPLAELLSSVGDADIFGASESEEITPHLQSYFLVFQLNAKTRAFLEEFWSKFRYVLSKRRLIWRYEFGISRQARQQGLSVRAFVSNAAARSVALSMPDHPYGEELVAGNVNNTLYLWDTMIERLRFPFLKADIPRVNRYQSTRVAGLSKFLAEHTTYPPHLIEDNLRRLREGTPTKQLI
jgi:lipopolysaccharide biosynthesis protein